MKSVKMTLTEIRKQSDEWKRTHWIMVYGQKDKTQAPKYFTDFQNQMLQFQNQMLQFQNQMIAFVKEQRQFNKFVLEQFKKHGWIE